MTSSNLELAVRTAPQDLQNNSNNKSHTSPNGINHQQSNDDDQVEFTAQDLASPTETNLLTTTTATTAPTLNHKAESLSKIDSAPTPQQHATVWIAADASFGAYTKQLLRFAWKTILTALLQFSIGTCTFLFINRLGVAASNGAGIGSMICNLTGMSIGFGMASALDALCSQAYGAKQYRLVGLQAQRGMLVLSLACVPLAMVWLQTERISLLIGMTTETSQMAGVWARYQIAGMWPMLMFDSLRRFQQAQGVMWPIVAAVGITATINAIANYCVVYVFKLGFTGPALVTILANWSLLIFESIFIFTRLAYRKRQRTQQRYSARLQQQQQQQSEIEASTTRELMSPGAESPGPQSDDYFNAMQQRNSRVSSESLTSLDSNGTTSQQQQFNSPEHSITMPKTKSMTKLALDDDDKSHADTADDVWPAPSLACFKGWSEFLRLAVPGSASVFIESGSFEGYGTMAARLGATSQNVHGIFAQTAGLWGAVPTGLAAAAATLMGNHLGRNEPAHAKRMMSVAFRLVLAWSIGNGLVFCAGLRPFWGSVYSPDATIVAAVAASFPIMFAYGVCDAIKAMSVSILRGTGRPQITVWSNIVACLLVSYPVAILVVFVMKGGLVALWSAMTLAWLTASTVYCTSLYRTDWKLQCDAVAARNKRGNAAENEPSPVLDATVTIVRRLSQVSMMIPSNLMAQFAVHHNNTDETESSDAPVSDTETQQQQQQQQQPEMMKSIDENGERSRLSRRSSISSQRHSVSDAHSHQHDKDNVVQSRTRAMPHTASNSDIASMGLHRGRYSDSTNDLDGLMRSDSSGSLASLDTSISSVNSSKDGHGTAGTGIDPNFKLESYVEKRRPSVITQQVQQIA